MNVAEGNLIQSTRLFRFVTLDLCTDIKTVPFRGFYYSFIMALTHTACLRGQYADGTLYACCL